MATTHTKTKTTNGKVQPSVLSRITHPDKMRPSKPRPVRWSYKQYQKMTALGWFDHMRVELIGGEVIEMAAMHEPHWVAGVLVEEVMRGVFGSGFIVVVQKPLHLPADSAPEPDVAIVRGAIRDFTEDLPTTADLIIEISYSTLHYDRTDKSSLYASAGIEDYWIVNLKARQLEIYRTPIESKKAKFGWDYKDKINYKKEDTISPLAAPKAKIKVADLLP